MLKSRLKCFPLTYKRSIHRGTRRHDGWYNLIELNDLFIQYFNLLQF